MEENIVPASGMIRYNDWQPELPEPEKKRTGKHMGKSKSMFWRYHGITLILLGAAAAFTLFVILFAWFRDRATEKRVYEEIGIEKGQKVVAIFTGTGELPESMQKILEVPDGFGIQLVDMRPKTGQDSYNEALKAIEDPLAIHVAGLRQKRKVTKAGAETYCWVDIARLKSGDYGTSLLDFLTNPLQIEGYYPDIHVRPEDREIAHRVAVIYMNGEFPDGFTVDFQYAEINPDGSVTARTELHTGSMTKFWRVEE